MNQPSELSLSAVNEKRQANGGMMPPCVEATVLSAGNPTETNMPAGPGQGLVPSTGGALAASHDDRAGIMPGFMLPFDPLRAADSLWKNISTCLSCGAVAGVLLYAAAKLRVEPHYTASAQLVKQSMPDSFRASQIGEAYKPHEIPIAILTTNLMRGRSLVERVGKRTNPAMDAETILNGLEVTTDKKSDVIHAAFTSTVSAARAAEIVNNYAGEVVKLTKELQAQDATEVNAFLKLQLTRCDADLLLVNEEMLRYAREADLLDGDREMEAYLNERATIDLKYEASRLDYETLDLKIQAVEKELAKVSPNAVKLQKAREELPQLLGRYTEQNPLVEELRDRIKTFGEALAKEASQHETAPPQTGESSIAASLYLQRIDLMSQKNVFGAQLKKIEDVREALSAKLNQLPRKTLEYALIKARLQSLDGARQLLGSRQREAELYMENSLGYYRVLQDAQSQDVVLDSRRSKRLIYGLSGFAVGFLAMAAWLVSRELSDGRVRTPADLRRVTRLPVLASLPADVGKDKTAQEAWAFRTWTRLHSKLKHADAALVCGLLAERETEHCAVLSRLLADAAAWRGAAVLVITARPPEDRPFIPLADALTSSLSEADRWLAGGNGVVFLHADANWSWNAEQRGQLDHALGIWSRHEQAIVFVELPPATQPETLLMAEQLPQLLWVGASGQKPGVALSETLATYRHAGCKLFGAMMNHTPRLKPAFLNQFAGTAALAFLIMINADTLLAQTPAPVPAAEPTAVSSESQSSKLKTLTLGPGDWVTIAMFGQAGSERRNLVIKPDGRLTYMQAQDIVAGGLTVDQLRAKLNEELSRYYNRPKVIVTPAAFHSHKVYILGKIMKKGTVDFDRPLTLLEAITEAGGLETGLYQQNTVELADLGRSFLSRRSQRVKVDFEALFQRGDMSQNVPLEPDDYIYFPSANNNEVYMIGNVRSQGTQGLLAQSSVTSAITLAGGFTPRAYREKVLVIRGSLDKPRAFSVNMNAVLSGREKGFKLEPNDIVYIADKPWARVEDLLDLAISTFIQGAVSGYITGNIAPLITKPLLSPSR